MHKPLCRSLGGVRATSQCVTAGEADPLSADGRQVFHRGLHNLFHTFSGEGVHRVSERARYIDRVTVQPGDPIGKSTGESFSIGAAA